MATVESIKTLMNRMIVDMEDVQARISDLQRRFDGEQRQASRILRGSSTPIERQLEQQFILASETSRDAEDEIGAAVEALKRWVSEH